MKQINVNKLMSISVKLYLKKFLFFRLLLSLICIIVRFLHSEFDVLLLEFFDLVYASTFACSEPWVPIYVLSFRVMRIMIIISIRSALCYIFDNLPFITNNFFIVFGLAICGNILYYPR